jgi:hypothetical protein
MQNACAWQTILSNPRIAAQRLRFEIPKAALSHEIAQRSEDNVINGGNALPFGRQHRAPEFGNHNSGIGPELSPLFCGHTLIFSERFPTSHRSIWYKW